jgi:hypothetical protein
VTRFFCHVKSMTSVVAVTGRGGIHPGALLKVEAARFSPRRRGAFGTSMAVLRGREAASARLRRARAGREGSGWAKLAHGFTTYGSSRGRGSERMRSGRTARLSARTANSSAWLDGRERFAGRLSSERLRFIYGGAKKRASGSGSGRRRCYSYSMTTVQLNSSPIVSTASPC